ncbi:MAG: catechol 2,3-dioxygenase-like lactoylglutathione lyase family enzyme [Woeseiaceae bacterium]|jgi:catechol 2,3-dioxygenase-like lactoylglutathione lyase family enzyme
MYSRERRTKIVPLVLALVLAACGKGESINAVAVSQTQKPTPTTSLPADVIATNAFYYYADVEAAWDFYSKTLGLETVVDYGFAKILRLADTSYLTLVQADEGMHSVEEAKTVTLNIVTDTLTPWYEYLGMNNVPLHSEIDSSNQVQANSFVAVDPEGYFLKFIRYNPHPNHDSYTDAFAPLIPVISVAAASLNLNLSIRATVFSAYFDEGADVVGFYESLFALQPVGQLDGQPLYQLAGSGFLSLVHGGDELHKPTTENGVTFSFLTTDVDAWFERATSWPGFELRTPEVLDEGGLVRVFVGYDPTGIFLEWDTFLDLEENALLMRHLSE